MSKTSDRVGEILNMGIMPGKWQQYYNLLYKDGRPDSKEVKKILFALCEIVEENEKSIQSPDSRLQSPTSRRKQ